MDIPVYAMHTQDRSIYIREGEFGHRVVCNQCAAKTDNLEGYFVIKLFEHYPKGSTCRKGVFLVKRYARFSDDPCDVFKWGRNFWWNPFMKENILCSVSRRWVQTWLLVCNRQNILPKDVVLEVIKWVVNLHTCHIIAIAPNEKRGYCTLDKSVSPIRLENVKEIGAPFVCDPDFEPFPKLGCNCNMNPGHWGPNVYANVATIRDTSRVSNIYDI